VTWLCELISHTAVCEDIARIVRGSQEIANRSETR
jgi:hypothetical protein